MKTQCVYVLYYEVLLKSSRNVFTKSTLTLGPIHHHHFLSRTLGNAYNDPSASATIGMPPGSPSSSACSAPPAILSESLPWCQIATTSVWGTGKNHSGLKPQRREGGGRLNLCFESQKLSYGQCADMLSRWKTQVLLRYFSGSIRLCPLEAGA